MMKWFLDDVAYAVWLALDHPEDWRRNSTDEWTYKNKLVFWVQDSRFVLWRPFEYKFGFITKKLLQRKFEKMHNKQIVGAFTKALLE